MRILVIEDEKEVADLVRRAMAEESHAVDVAHDGLTGEDFIASETYDLIILDIMLPKKDGLAVLKTLRKEEIATPVLLLTARDEVPDRVKGLDDGGLKNAQELLPHDFLGRRAGNYNVLLDEHRYRVRVFRRLWGAVAVGVENETIFRVAKEAGEILVWIVPFALIFAATGGWLLAKLAMRPVLAAAKAAETISVTNLKNRLPVYAGKDEFGKLVATLNHMIAHLQDGVNRLQQFTQDAAHELRTPRCK